VLVWCSIKGCTVIAFVVIVKCTMLEMLPAFIHFQFCASTTQVDLPVQSNHIHITLYPWRKHVLKHTGTHLHITTQNTIVWAHKISTLTMHDKTVKGKAVYTIKTYGEQKYISALFWGEKSPSYHGPPTLGGRTLVPKNRQTEDKMEKPTARRRVWTENFR
jgi:hypothetical protein